MNFSPIFYIVVVLCIDKCKAYLPCQSCTVSGPKTSSRLIGYYYRTKVDALPIESIDAGSLTHLVWNGFTVANGRCEISNLNTDLQQTYGSNSLGIDVDAAYHGQLYQLRLLKLKYPHLSLLVTIPGIFQTTGVSSLNTRASLVSSCAALARQYLFDGVEFDWVITTDGDKFEFAQLLSAFKQANANLTVVSQIRGPLATMYSRYDFTTISASVDWVHFSAFNLWESSLRPGHHSPLYWSPYSPVYDSVDSWVRYLLKNGVPPCKIVLGLSLSGPAWSLTDSVSPTSPDAILAIFNQSRAMVYSGRFAGGYRLRFRDVSHSFSLVFDAACQTSGYLSSQTFASVEGIQAMQIKARYASHQNLGGIYLHDLSADIPSNGIVQAVRSALVPLTPCKNLIANTQSLSTPTNSVKSSTATINTKVVTYLTMNNIDHVEGNQFTHAIYDQLNWTSISMDTRSSMIDLNLRRIATFRKKYPQVCLLLQVGNNIEFSKVVGNNATRMALVSAIIANVNYFEFNGVSVNWDDTSGQISNKFHLATFMSQLQLRLSSDSALTMELKFRTESFDVRYNLTLVDSFVDWYHVRPFDFGLQVAVPFTFSSWYLPDTGANFFDKVLVLSALNRILIEPILPSKIVLVLPMFGLQLISTYMDTWMYLAWYYPAILQSSVIPSANVIKAANTAGWVQLADPVPNVTLLYQQSLAQMILYDGIGNIITKVDQAKTWGLAGVGFYDVSTNDARVATAIARLPKNDITPISSSPRPVLTSATSVQPSFSSQDSLMPLGVCNQISISKLVQWNIADFPIMLQSVIPDPSVLLTSGWTSPKLDLSSASFVLNSPADLDLVLSSRSLKENYAGQRLFFFLNLSCSDPNHSRPTNVIIPTSLAIPPRTPTPEGLTITPNTGEALLTVFNLEVSGDYHQSACARYFVYLGNAQVPLGDGNCIPTFFSLKTVLPASDNSSVVIVAVEVVDNGVVSEGLANVTVQISAPEISLNYIEDIFTPNSRIPFCDHVLSTVSIISRLSVNTTTVRARIMEMIKTQYLEAPACPPASYQDLAFITVTSELLKDPTDLNNGIAQDALDVINKAMNKTDVMQHRLLRERIAILLSSLLLSKASSGTLSYMQSIRNIIDRLAVSGLSNLAGGERDSCRRSISTDAFNIQTYKLHALGLNSAPSCSVTLPLDLVTRYRGRTVGVVSTIYQLVSGLPSTTNLVHSVNVYIDNSGPATIQNASSPFKINMGLMPSSGVRLECGWILPNGRDISKTGCETQIAENRIVTCNCYHLTDFVLIITESESITFVSSNTKDVQSWAFSLANLFNLALSVVSLFLGCFGKYVITNAESYKTFSIMAILIVVKCVARAAFYGTILFGGIRPNGDLFLARLMFGTITQFSQFMIFGYLLCLLIIILSSIVTMNEKPLALRNFLFLFQSVIKVLIVTSLGVPALLIYGSVRFDSQGMFFAASAYILILNILLTLSIPATGIIIARYLVNHSHKRVISNNFAIKRYLKLAKFMRIITIAMGICLSLQAGLWTWSIVGLESYNKNTNGSLAFVVLDTVATCLVLTYQCNVAWTQYCKKKREESLIEKNVAAHFRDDAVRVVNEQFVYVESKRIKEPSVWDNVFDEFANGLGSKHMSFDNDYSSDDGSRPW